MYEMWLRGEKLLELDGAKQQVLTLSECWEGWRIDICSLGKGSPLPMQHLSDSCEPNPGEPSCTLLSQDLTSQRLILVDQGRRKQF